VTARRRGCTATLQRRRLPIGARPPGAPATPVPSAGNLALFAPGQASLTSRFMPGCDLRRAAGRWRRSTVPGLLGQALPSSVSHSRWLGAVVALRGCCVASGVAAVLLPQLRAYGCLSLARTGWRRRPMVVSLFPPTESDRRGLDRRFELFVALLAQCMRSRCRQICGFSSTLAALIRLGQHEVLVSG
jgi:hypothetical protein